ARGVVAAAAAVVVLAPAEAAGDAQHAALIVDRDHGVVAHGPAGAAQILDRLAGAKAARIALRLHRRYGASISRSTARACATAGCDGELCLSANATSRRQSGSGLARRSDDHRLAHASGGPSSPNPRGAALETDDHGLSTYLNIEPRLHGAS